jgi:hypothetical protein
MQDIQRVLAAAARRLLIADFLRRLVGVGTLAGALALFAVVVGKLSPLAMDGRLAFGVAVGLSVVVAALAAVVRRPRGLALADEVDRRAGLKETLSTAVAATGRTDAWSLAVAESAAERARRVVLRDAVPVRASARWGLPVLLLAAGLGVHLFAPRHDLSGLLDRRVAESERDAAVHATALEIKAREAELSDLLDRAGVELAADQAEDDAAQGDAETPEELNRAALRCLTQISDQLQAMQQSEQARRLDAMREAMQRLRTPGPGPATDLARALAQGRFGDAKAALEKLEAAAQAGALSEADRAAAAEQLEQLAEQVERLAAEREALRERLEQMGMSPEQASRLAGDPSALQNALQQMQGLSAADRDALMNSVMSRLAASEAMQSMAQAMSQMSQCMAGGQPMQGAGQLTDQLSAAEMLAAEMRALNQAAIACNAQMQQYGQSLREGGACMNPGMAQGDGQRVGRGIGRGGDIGRANPDLPPADDYVLKGEKTSVPNQGGPIIGSTLVYGAQVKGEATAQFGEVVNASAVQASEAIESMRVPREYHDAVRHYFGRLEAIAKKPAEPEAD